MSRLTRIAPRGQTIRRQGLDALSLDAAPSWSDPAFAKGFATPTKVLAIEDPPNLWIPDYLNNPDVGLLTPRGDLTLYTGSWNITDGTYDGMKFVGPINTFGNPIFNDCWFEGKPDFWGVVPRSGRATFNDCEFTDYDRALHGLGGTYTAYKCKTDRCWDAFKVSPGCIVRMCHTTNHENVVNSGGHADSVQSENTLLAGNGALFEYNNLDGWNTARTSQTSGVFQLQPEGNWQDDVTVHNNLMQGAGYQMRAYNKSKDGTDYTLINVKVTDNIHTRDSRFGPNQINPGTISEWSGNYFIDDIGGTEIPINYLPNS